MNAARTDTVFPECDEGALVAAARAAGEDVDAGLELAERYGICLPLPGGGATAQRWRLLAAVAAEDLTAARILEAHSDALAILAEAGEPLPSGRWGVFAAEASDVALTAWDGNEGWTVDGTKPWCSLSGRLDSALVTARVGSARRMFAVDLHHDSVHAEQASRWVARGLRAIPSGSVHFGGTPARPIGAPDWYLTRSGFDWGGIGVAACWYGGARALADRLQSRAEQRPGDLISLSVGTVDVGLHAAWTCLVDAARHVDEHPDDQQGELLALRVRSVVAAAAERVLCQVGHSLGPAPLAFEETHARRVADLQIYLRQHHAERDLAALGHRLLDGHPR